METGLESQIISVINDISRVITGIFLVPLTLFIPCQVAPFKIRNESDTSIFETVGTRDAYVCASIFIFNIRYIGRDRDLT